jgi:hypothetical protein
MMGSGAIETLRPLFARVQKWATRHPVLFVFLLALSVRLLVAIVLTISVGMEKFPDTEGYDRLAADRVSGAYHDWNASSTYYWTHYNGYVLPLAILYRLFGSHLLLGQLLGGALGAAAAAAICRLVLEVSTRHWALFAGLIVALFPSQVLWSSVAYKDSAVWAATAGMALIAAWAARVVGWRLACLGGALGLFVFWLGHLRWPTLVVTAWALVIAAVVSAPRGRIARVLGAVLIAVLMPMYLGLGPGGVDYVSKFSPSEVRESNARDADTAFVSDEESGGLADLEHLPRGLSVIALEPYPWTSFRGYEVRLAQAELLVWYPLLIVSGFGMATVVRKRRELAFLAVTAGGMLVVYALYEGNFGTAFRHRSELVPALAVFAALGAPRLLAIWRRADDRPPNQAVETVDAAGNHR